MDSQEGNQTCGRILAAVKIIGDKWSSLIINELVGGPRRFGEIADALGVGPRTLSQRLDAMETEGVVAKQHFNEVPPRVEYSLTKKGRDLVPVLLSMAEWCTKYPAVDAGSDKGVQ